MKENVTKLLFTVKSSIKFSAAPVGRAYMYSIDTYWTLLIVIVRFSGS